MKTPQWIKKLGGHAGELYVAAELSKRGILNSLLPENFSDDDIMIGKKGDNSLGYIQVKSCHPDRGDSFRLDESDEKWEKVAKNNQFMVFVWLGSPTKNESPRYWIARKKDVGTACKKKRPKNLNNKERRFWLKHLDANWENNWDVLKEFLP